MGARSRGGGGAGAISIQAHVDAAKASRDFTAARRDVDARTKDGLQRAGERVALPEAKRRAGNLAVTTLKAHVRTATTLTVKARARDALLTTTLTAKAARAVGLQEFGGTVTTIIRPRRKKALSVGDGVVAHVDTPRHYRGRRFMTGAVEAKAPQIQDAIVEEVMHAFDGWETS